MQSLRIVWLFCNKKVWMNIGYATFIEDMLYHYGRFLIRKIKSLFVCKKYSNIFCRYRNISYLCTRKTKITLALLAQLVEQLTLNQWVQGSNP